MSALVEAGFEPDNERVLASVPSVTAVAAAVGSYPLVTMQKQRSVRPSIPLARVFPLFLLTGVYCRGTNMEVVIIETCLKSQMSVALIPSH